MTRPTAEVAVRMDAVARAIGAGSTIVRLPDGEEERYPSVAHMREVLAEMEARLAGRNVFVKFRRAGPLFREDEIAPMSFAAARFYVEQGAADYVDARGRAPGKDRTAPDPGRFNRVRRWFEAPRGWLRGWT